MSPETQGMENCVIQKKTAVEQTPTQQPPPVNLTLKSEQWESIPFHRKKWRALSPHKTVALIYTLIHARNPVLAEDNKLHPHDRPTFTMTIQEPFLAS